MKVLDRRQERIAIQLRVNGSDGAQGGKLCEYSIANRPFTQCPSLKRLGIRTPCRLAIADQGKNSDSCALII